MLDAAKTRVCSVVYIALADCLFLAILFLASFFIEHAR